MSVIGDNIKKYRIMNGLTQKEVADLVGKTKNVVSKWELGTNNPDADTIELLLGIFGVDANTLLGWDNPKQLNDDAQDLVEAFSSDPKIKDFLPLLQKLSEEDMNLAISFIKRLTGKDE
jgi:transcriptional regulator with XRE-family HTH domain